jgi:glycosyltransferase involved in cell wall biosynthesis
MDTTVINYSKFKVIKAPVVSVVMPVYNAELFLSASIESILSQTFTDFEFIIINDGSTDNSLRVINYYKDKDERISVVNQENKGLSFALNTGISKCSGKYIARMDADDIAVSNRFKIQVDFLNTNKDISVLSGAVNYIDIDNNILGRSFPITWTRVIKKMLFKGNPINHPASMIRKEDLDKVGQYSEIINSKFEDMHLWCQFLKKGYKIKNLSTILLNYRISKNSISSQFIISNRTTKLLQEIMLAKTPTLEMIQKIKEFQNEEAVMAGEVSRNHLYENVLNTLYLKIKPINQNFAEKLICGLSNINVTLKNFF